MVWSGPDMAEPGGSEDGAQGRVELAHYAWVTAALAEGFGLDEVLTLEGLEPAAWDHAELSWRTRLATEPDVCDQYRSHLAEAEDELGGKVTPLDEDLEAWVLFLKIYGDHPAPFQLLAQQRLRPGDLARLQRKWARRLETDEELVEQAGDLRDQVTRRAEEGEQLPLPAITVAPQALHPSPYGRGSSLPAGEALASAPEPAAPDGAAATPAAPQLELYDYAALCAALDDEGADEVAVLRTYGLTLEAGKRLHDAWRAQLAADPALAADFRSLHRHFNEREGLRGTAPASHGVGPAWSSAAPPDQSPAPALPPPQAPAAQAAPPQRSDRSAARAEPPQRASEDSPLGMTLEGDVMAPRIVLPFSPGGAPDPSKPRASTPASSTEPGKPSPGQALPGKLPTYNPSFGRTAPPGAKVPKITLPFKAKPGGAPAPEPPPDQGPQDERLGYNPAFGQTATPTKKGPKITLPFKAKPGGAPAPEPRPDEAQPDERPGQDPSLGSTVGLDGPVPKSTLPFQPRDGQKASPDPDKPEEGGAAPGGRLATARELAKKVAGWEVNHYASLCAELAERPEQTDAVRQRYGLADSAAEAYVHELWQMRFIDDEEARKEWQRLLKEYRRALAEHE